MRLLFLCKRRPQGRDLITRPFGRFFYLPYHLAQQGCEVTLLLLDYEDSDSIHCHAHGMEWFSVSLRRMGRKSNPATYLRLADMLIKSQSPDWVVGFSDTWYGILAAYLGKRHDVKILIDAYDNYESYIPWFKPLHWLWRYSLRQSTALSAAGPELAELMGQGRAHCFVAVIPMAADPIFQPLSDINLRKRFELSEKAPLVGYCGSLYKNRGVEVLFQAMQYVLDDIPDAKLVISGRHEQGLVIPEFIRNAVIQLGYLPDEQIPFLLNALDVLLVINLNTAFGNYSYPVKLYEAMRCCKPVVASDTAGTRWILRDHPECLVESGNPKHLARCIRDALSLKEKEYISDCDWVDSASILRDLLESSRFTMQPSIPQR
jgi:glycosyltransferase involved in cell wall biosynthesis